jgi:hypothetical protein
MLSSKKMVVFVGTTQGVVLSLLEKNDFFRPKIGKSQILFRVKFENKTNYTELNLTIAKLELRATFLSSRK